MRELLFGSLFSGCGGLDLGLERAGWSIAWGCENDRACRTVLADRRPNLEVVEDVRLVDAGTPCVDLLAGGFPCPDFSCAGNRSGFDGEGAALWHEFARCVRLLRPRVVVVENVGGLATAQGLALDAGESALGVVLSDLAAAGYVGQWLRLRAADVGAPHRRERLFIVATDSERVREHPDGDLCSGDARSRDRSARASLPSGPEVARAADALADRAGAAADSDSWRREVVGEQEPSGLEGASGREPDGRDYEWGVYGPAIERWSRLFRPAPSPTDDRGRLMPEFVEWMMGFPEGWTAGVRRTHRLRMLGNAVQVQCAEVVGLVALSALVEADQEARTDSRVPGVEGF